MSGRYRFYSEFDGIDEPLQQQFDLTKKHLNQPYRVAGRWGDDDEDTGYGSYNGYSSNHDYDNWDEDGDEFRDEEDDFLEVDERPSWLREAEGRRRTWVNEDDDESVVIVHESRVTTTITHPEPGVTEISTTEVTVEMPMHVVNQTPATEPAIDIEARPVTKKPKKAATKPPARKAAAKKPAAKAAKKAPVKAAKAAKKAARKSAGKPAKQTASKPSVKKTAKKATAKKAAKKAVKKVVAKKVTAKKAAKPVKKTAPKKAAKTSAKKTATKKVVEKAVKKVASKPVKKAAQKTAKKAAKKQAKKR